KMLAVSGRKRRGSANCESILRSLELVILVCSRRRKGARADGYNQKYRPPAQQRLCRSLATSVVRQVGAVKGGTYQGFGVCSVGGDRTCECHSVSPSRWSFSMHARQNYPSRSGLALDNSGCAVRK